jgi:uncharacterized peroxidase-related enzyme
MEKLKPLAESSATGLQSELFEDLKREMRVSWVPNFMRVCANSPTAAIGIWECAKQIMFKGRIDPALKQLMFVAISAMRNCQYCEAAHLSWCRMMGVDEATLAAVAESAENPRINPAVARDVIAFAVKAALTPSQVTAGDFDKLRGHGLDHEQLMEIVAMAAMAVFHNIIADTTGIAVDEAYAASKLPLQAAPK